MPSHLELRPRGGDRQGIAEPLTSSQPCRAGGYGRRQGGVGGSRSRFMAASACGSSCRRRAHRGQGLPDNDVDVGGDQRCLRGPRLRHRWLWPSHQRADERLQNGRSAVPLLRLTRRAEAASTPAADPYPDRRGRDVDPRNADASGAGAQEDERGESEDRAHGNPQLVLRGDRLFPHLGIL
jgi:hypothetical protein